LLIILAIALGQQFHYEDEKNPNGLIVFGITATDKTTHSSFMGSTLGFQPQ
jgi:hypothetical protein